MNVFYAPELSTITTLDESESFHLCKVLRSIQGDRVYITNGLGVMTQGTVIKSHPKASQIALDEIPQPMRETHARLHLAIAPTKTMERFEYFLEKSTEMGIDQITPILCFHSERKSINMERCQKIILSASKQSMKSRFPVLNPLTPFNTWIERPLTTPTYMAHCRENFERIALSKILETQRDVCVLIGPEGDFSNHEVTLANEHSIQNIDLGPYRLRTETAAIHICSAFMFMNV